MTARPLFVALIMALAGVSPVGAEMDPRLPEIARELARQQAAERPACVCPPPDPGTSPAARREVRLGVPASPPPPGPDR